MDEAVRYVVNVVGSISGDRAREWHAGSGDFSPARTTSLGRIAPGISRASCISRELRVLETWIEGRRPPTAPGAMIWRALFD